MRGRPGRPTRLRGPGGAVRRRNRPARARRARRTAARTHRPRQRALGSPLHRRRSRHRNGRLDDRLAFGRRLLWRSGPSRQKRERVEIPVRVRSQADAEIHVRLGHLRLAARADRPDDVPLLDCGSDRDADRAQVDQGDGVPVLGTDRHAAPLARQLTCEGDDPGRRCAHVGSRRRADVDPAVLAAGVRVVAGDERPQHRPVDRPGPGSRARDVREGDEQHGPNDDDYFARFENHAGQDTEPIGCCQI